ncbi:oligosaccharide flippase family protein [Peribacillus butanolivorans]|uniref:oligosaccharide flippase family protein n=1 Tax=Peribacillus butanolivorans TaxID=421767 RepID=UPI0036D8C4C8
MEKIKKTIIDFFQQANKIGFLHLLSANILIQITGFGGQIFLTRILSVEDIGTIKVLQTYLSIFVIIASFGLNTSVLKMCSEDISREEQKSIFSVSFFITIVTSLILISIVIMLQKFSIFKVNNYFSVYMFLIPIFSLTNLLIVYLQSQRKIKTISLIQSFSRIFIIIISTFIAFWFGLKGYINSLVILNLFSFLLILLFIRKEIQFQYLINITISKLKKIFNIAIFALGSNLLGTLLLNVNIIIATILSINSKEIGYYSIAQLIISTLMIIPSTLGQVMIPRISRISHDIDGVKEILKNYQNKNGILALLVSLFLGILAPLIIPLVFGENYSNSVLYLEILLIGFVFWSIYSPIGNTLLSVGRSDINFYMNSISIVINIILNYFFISKLGMLGAAIANTITYFLTIFIYKFLFKKMYLLVRNRS